MLNEKRPEGIYWGWTAEQRRTLARMYEQGATLDEAAEACGKTRASVSTEAWFYNFNFRGAAQDFSASQPVKIQQKDNRRRAFTQAEYDAILTLRKQGISRQKISKMLHIAYYKLAEILLECGDPVPRTIPMAVKKTEKLLAITDYVSWTDTNVDEVQALRKKGFSKGKIAHIVHIAEDKVTEILHLYGDPSPWQLSSQA